MTEILTVAIAQINPTVGDICGNADLVRGACAEAGDADLVVFGELTISGYPPEDLVLKDAFIDNVEAAIKSLADDTAAGGAAILVGAPWRLDGSLYNAVLLLDDGEIKGVSLKSELPNYGVFDEKRVFSAGPVARPIDFRGLKLGVMICEDMWTGTVSDNLAGAGSDILIAINGSPFEIDKCGERHQLAAARATATGLPVIYVNLVGGQDELVFDGASFVVSQDGNIIVQAGSWAPVVVPTIWQKSGGSWSCREGMRDKTPGHLESIYMAMTTGLADYVGKNGFPGVVIGLSGGIDSALSAAIAVDALGAEKVHCVMMDSPHTSDESIEDASATAELLGVRMDRIKIEPAMKVFDGMLEDTFRDCVADTTEENIQARIRGLILMAISNKLGHMVLTTGNKSEMSVGYATLYGDMCGGYSVLKDVYKTDVFALSRWRNKNLPSGVMGRRGPVMPDRVITKPPSAELRENQTDQDSLPPYDVLDPILEYLVEGDGSVSGASGRGFDARLVRRIWNMLCRAEYKRRQAPPGVKITRLGFGRDRRYPLTNRYQDKK